MASISKAQAAAELLRRDEAQSDLVAWGRIFAEEKGFQLATHHRVMLQKLQQATDGTLLQSKSGRPTRNLIISMPPGSAKSFYSSIVFPVWFLNRKKASRVLACSHTADLIEGFSRECRNTVEINGRILGYELAKDSRSIQEWATTNGGLYKCAGVGASIAGRRADLGIIDDYIGTQEDADSDLVRRKVWAWYLSDFHTRLKPNSTQVIIATRWHEDDLIGRLLDPQNKYNSPISPLDWEYVRFPFFAEKDDALGRPDSNLTSLVENDIYTAHDDDLLQKPAVVQVTETRIWPEYFTPSMALGVLRKPSKVRAGLYQQRPSPENGDYFKSDWMEGYTRDEYDSLQRKQTLIFGAGDWACSDAEESGTDVDFTCFGPATQDENGVLYILPDIFWKQAGPEEVLTSFIALLKRRQFMEFWSEKGQISKSWGPFLKKMMLEEGTFQHITEVTPSRNKQVRAQSIRGLMSMRKVRFPKFASWWPEAEAQLLAFPSVKHDDFVDFLAHLGAGVMSMVKARPAVRQTNESIIDAPPITLRWMKESDKQERRAKQPLYNGR